VLENSLGAHFRTRSATKCTASEVFRARFVGAISSTRNVTLTCSKVPTKDMFVMLERSDSFLYLYNHKEGLLSLPEGEADTVRFRECQGYLNRD